MKNTKRICIAVALALLLLAGVAALAWRLTSQGEDPAPPSTEDSTSSPPPAAASLPMELGNGLRLVELFSAAGVFPEDGKDDFLPDVLCATIQNTTAQTLSIGRVELTGEGGSYIFEITSIPPGAKVHAYETHRKPAPSRLDEMEGTSLFAAYREVEPLAELQGWEITVEKGGIHVKNVSGQDLDRTLRICYKRVHNEIYVGGITYCVRLTELRAGESVMLQAAHATPDNTRIMYVEYE